MADEEKAAAPEAPVKAPKCTSVLVTILLTLVCNAAGVGVTWYVLNKSVAAHGEAGEEKKEGEPEEDMAEVLEKGAVLPLDPFVVNLADTDAARYLRIKVSLMVDDKEKIAEVVENMALQGKVRDVILQTLTRKTSQDLVHDEGKNHLRQEIQEQVQGFFKDPKLVDVMFTEFVIQL